MSEDPVPYRCGNERTMKFDGSFASIVTWRVAGSIEGDGLSWRFITLDGGAVAVRPVQLPSNERPFCVPEAIQSAMHSVSELIDWAHGRCGVKGEPQEVALYEINAFIGRITGKRLVTVREPAKGGGYPATERAAIVKRLTDPKNPGAKKLEAIRAFIVQELFKPGVPEIIKAPKGKPILAELKTYPPPSGPSRDADLRRLVRFMGEQTGQDMTLPVLLNYNPDMPGWFKGWVAETVKARKMKPKEAEQFLARHVTFIAECEGRRFWHCYPIEDLKADDVKGQEDRAPYQILIRHEHTNSQGQSTTQEATYAKHAPAGEKGKGKPSEIARGHPIAASVVTFADAFATIHYPFSNGQPLKLRATLKARVLQSLFENWKEKENGWLEWSKLASGAGIQGVHQDPYRFFEDRKKKRPEIKRVFREIVERDKAPSNTGTDYRVRLNPAYSYLAPP